ncbi:MAG: recombinase family protein [Clostridia bacterium]|nr:recombinase family protein [Clostridia bacterium]
MPPRVFLYVRESRDEGGEHRDRIDTQREMLLRYAAENRLGEVVGILEDDDATGTDFRRLDRVRTLAAAGEIDILLLKDSSRLGRNLKESLLFTEFLEGCGVELCFAGGTYNEDLFPLEAWFHEMRAKEDSRKIRGVLYHKMATGDFLISPPYGYLREGNRLVPDPEAGPVVRRIFDLFLGGASTGEVAHTLNGLGIPTPSAHKGIRGAAVAWSAGSIRRILGDPCYLGIKTNRKTVGKSFKNKKRIPTDPKDRVVLPGDHEGLIPEACFFQAAQRLRESTRGGGQASPYRGMVICGGCGSRLMLRTRSDRDPALICPKWHRQGKRACTSHHIPIGDLDRAVRGAVRGFYCENRQEPIPQSPGPALETLYEDLLAGRISPAFFENMRQRFTLASKTPNLPLDLDPFGWEERAARLLIEKMVVLDPGDGVEKKTLRVFLAL